MIHKPCSENLGVEWNDCIGLHFLKPIFSEIDLQNTYSSN